MPCGRLHLISRGHYSEGTCSSSKYLPTDQLWKKASDESLHVLFRESAMTELGKRGESGVSDLCISMLSSEDIDEWFSALRVLRSLGTVDAADILLDHCNVLDLTHRRIVLSELTHLLPPTKGEVFADLLRPTVSGGTLNVTGWTDAAFLSLCDIAREKGVRIMLTYHPSEDSTFSAVEQDEGVHLTTAANT